MNKNLKNEKKRAQKKKKRTAEKKRKKGKEGPKGVPPRDGLIRTVNRNRNEIDAQKKSDFEHPRKKMKEDERR